MEHKIQRIETYQQDLVDIFREKWPIGIVKKIFFSFPVSIRTVSLSIFLFIFGWWLWGDAFFSLYIKDIVDHVFRVSLIGAILSLGKLVFSIPVGEVNNHADLKSVLFLSKGMYVITGILYFLAGILRMPVILIAAVLLNGLAASTMWVTYQTFIRKYSPKNTRWWAFGLYFSSMNLAYVLWALWAVVLIKYLPLPYVFLFVSLFAFVSLGIDQKLPTLSRQRIRAFLGKDTFIHKFFGEVCSLRSIRKVITTIKTYPPRMYYALGFEWIYSILNYVWFIFIPIVSVANNLSLSQVALVFAVMRVPYLIDVFIGNIADNTSKRKFLYSVLLLLSCLYMLLGYNEWFRNIMLITFGISFWLSLMRPVISSYVSDCARPEDEWTITWAGEFVAKLWEMIGVIVFGAISVWLWLSYAFVIIGIGIFLFALVGLIKRFWFFKYDG